MGTSLKYTEDIRMKKLLLPQGVNSYKACLHTHTTLSDGVKTPEEIKELYMAQGYSVIAYTDHDVFICHDDLCDEHFLALNGYELEVTEPLTDSVVGSVRTCHMCFIAKDQSARMQVCYNKDKYIREKHADLREKLTFDRDDYERVYSHEGVNDMMRLGRENGFFVSYNHPTWSQESYPEYSGYQGMQAMEVVNGACCAMGYDEINTRVYDDLLRQGKRIFCTATDDVHRIERDAFRGWVVFRAAELTYPCIIDALEKGSFYASTGPDILDLWVEAGRVHVKTSPVHAIRMDTGARHSGIVSSGDWENTVDEAEFELRPTDRYFRIDAVDVHGGRAFSNACWLDELGTEAPVNT